jgi:succinoglycan biosynthesis protein ExoL
MARVVFFAFDIAEAAQLRRIDSIRALGHEVASVSFVRDNMSARGEPDWPNLPLGPSSNNRYLLRLARLGRAALRLWRGRSVLGGSDVWIARNLDMVLLAVLMRLTGRRDVKLVYECLDIHGLFTRTDAVGAIMRWVERRMLARCDLLILSSPGFLDAYFRPIQHIETPVALLENKLWVSDVPLPRPMRPRARNADAPFVLGWVGSLRCARSLDILAGCGARAWSGGRDRVPRRGAHRHAIPGVSTPSWRRIPTSAMPGPYRYPDDLSAIYTGCDAVWAQDLWQAGATATGCCPTGSTRRAISAVPPSRWRGRETGRRISADGLGLHAGRATAEALTELLRGLDIGGIARRRSSFWRARRQSSG